MRVPETPRDRPRPGDWRILVLGEVLFDCFPDGPRLGGAPFNVAWHLTGLGARPRFVSRVGTDPLADEIRAAMDRHGMDTAGLQTDSDHPTGQVRIDLDGKGGHDFEILKNQAYDHIDTGQVKTQLADFPPDLVYFGTLAMRDGSREAITAAVTGCKGVRFLDVNLRVGCWSGESLTHALALADVVKLNDEELAVLSDMYGFTGSPEAQTAALRVRFALSGVCVTRGVDGAMWHTENGTLTVDVPPADVVVDTVGAGDGFAAMLIFGLLAGVPENVSMSDVLDRAARFAAAICGMRGACPEDAAFYEPHARPWAVRCG